MSLVRDYLYTEPVFVDVDTTVAESGKKMVEANIGAVIVKNGDGKPVGIFTERDFLYAVTKDGKPESTTMKEWATGVVISINKEASIEKGLEKMLDKGIRRLLVVDDDDNAVGFLTMKDLTEALYEEVQELR